MQRTPSWGCSLREWGYSCYLPSSGVSGDATARDSRCAAVRGEAEAEAEAIRNRQRTCRDLGGDHALDPIQVVAEFLGQEGPEL